MPLSKRIREAAEAAGIFVSLQGEWIADANQLSTFALAMHRQGQEEMRERCIEVCQRKVSIPQTDPRSFAKEHIYRGAGELHAEAIRALPVEEPK